MRRYVIVAGVLAGSAAAALAGFAIYTVATASDYTPGQPQLRFTIAAGCPSRLASFGDVRAEGSGLGHALAPGESATAGLICRYRAERRYAASLDESVPLSAAAAQAIGTALAGVDIKSAPDETSCPSDSGNFAVVVLAYSDRPDVDVRYDDAGCRTLDNGIVQTWEVANPSFYERFASTYARVLHGR